MMTALNLPDSHTTTPDIFAIERPHRNLMAYYALAAIITGPAFVFVILPLYYRYHSMRYRFTEEGVTMRWGVLFRKEINLTYARIQDIHLTSNFVERWLGLARIQIQTASGSVKAEMTIEGVPHYEALRDFLYSRMRGAKDQRAAAMPAAAVAGSPASSPLGVADDTHELAVTLRHAAAELGAIRKIIESRDEGVGRRDPEAVDG